MTPSGLTPELNSTQLLSFVPRIGEMCHVDCVQLYSLDSTNIRPAHWLGVARAVRENYDRYDGFVISHGTDTMAYTAAALSYLIQGSPKPIVLTGSAEAYLVRRYRLQAQPDRRVSLRLSRLRRRADRIQRQGHPGYPCPQDLLQELSGLFQRQLSRPGRGTGRAPAAVYALRLLSQPGVL